MYRKSKATRLVDDFISGDLSRRDFNKTLAAAGLGAAGTTMTAGSAFAANTNPAIWPSSNGLVMSCRNFSRLMSRSSEPNRPSHFLPRKKRLFRNCVPDSRPISPIRAAGPSRAGTMPALSVPSTSRASRPGTTSSRPPKKFAASTSAANISCCRGTGATARSSTAQTCFR